MAHSHSRRSSLGRTAPQFARRLVLKRFSFVSVLHGGVDALRTEEASRVLTLCHCRGFSVDVNGASVMHCTALRSAILAKELSAV